MSKQPNPLRTIALLTVLILCSALGAMAAQAPIAEISVDSSTIVWQPFGQQPLVLTVSGPGGYFRQEFDSKSAPYFEIFDDKGQILADGSYTWELTETPAVSAETRAAMARARETGNYSAVERLLPTPGEKQSGAFAIEGGAFVAPDLEEKALPNPDKAAGGYSIESTDRGAVTLPNPDKDQVIADDLIVDGSLCVGFDCVNNEAFGFDTIRLKENNLRILFQDTSVGAFPSRDWQLVANDSASGGANKFSIEDVDGARTPFTIEAAAPTNSLYVDDGGRLGLGTSTPVLDVHVVSGNTPAVRLEQDGSSGFTPQTWDIAGNEAVFFVRDVTSGSRLPFKIQPGAASNSLVVSSDSDVGVGTLSPDAALHVLRSDGTARVLIEETTSTSGNQELLTLSKTTASSSPFIRFSGAFGDWDFTGGNVFSINDPADGAVEMQLDRNGVLTVFDLIETSDVNAKENFSPVDPLQVLSSVASLPISTWNFKNQGSSIRQFGPMAQDFYAAFGVGHSDTTISSRNLAGVALAAIQGLNQKLADVQNENAQLLERLAALEAKLQAGN